MSKFVNNLVYKKRSLRTAINKTITSNTLLKIKNIIGIIFNELFYFKYNKHYKETKTKKQLKQLKNRHINERCFIIATGPSINKIDFSKINNEILFGMNTLYKGLDKYKIHPKYYGVVDGELFKKHCKNILKLDTTLFIGGSAGRYYLKNKKRLEKYQTKSPIVLKSGKDLIIWNEMSTDLLKGSNGANTVAIDGCLQPAFYLGFKEAYLLGTDCDHSKGVHFDKLVKFTGEQKFWLKIFKAYEICKKAFEDDGRKIYNSTVGGKLEVFERKKLEDI